MPWRQIHNASSGGDVVDAFGVNTIPATFLIDPNGNDRPAGAARHGAGEGAEGTDQVTG